MNFHNCILGLRNYELKSYFLFFTWISGSKIQFSQNRRNSIHQDRSFIILIRKSAPKNCQVSTLLIPEYYIHMKNTIANPDYQNNNKTIALWLFAVSLLIFCMIILGGATRLTRSGLSIVEWKPVTGILPPIGRDAWEVEFEKYRQFPEYQKKNQGMSLEEFQSIFWYEYSHRLLGRIIGIVFFFPFVFFLLRKKIPSGMILNFIFMFLLGGFQGLLGWYMVKSGLVDRPQVSQYRLTAHLISAIAIYAYILWFAIGLYFKGNPGFADSQKVFKKSFSLTVLILIVILSGGFMAGTRAGFMFNTFPKMNGNWVPDGMYNLNPWIINWFENTATIHFNHRMLAYLAAVFILMFFFYARKIKLPSDISIAVKILPVVLACQIILGISTLLLVVPVVLASLHQMFALILFSISFYITRRIHTAT